MFDNGAYLIKCEKLPGFGLSVPHEAFAKPGTPVFNAYSKEIQAKYRQEYYLAYREVMSGRNQ